MRRKKEENQVREDESQNTGNSSKFCGVVNVVFNMFFFHIVLDIPLTGLSFGTV